MLRRPDLSRPKRPKRKELTDEQKTEIREAFDLFDLEQTGNIDYHQLKVAMRALGFDVRKKDVLTLMEDYDLQCTGFIDYAQFLEIMTVRISARDPDDEATHMPNPACSAAQRALTQRRPRSFARPSSCSTRTARGQSRCATCGTLHASWARTSQTRSCRRPRPAPSSVRPRPSESAGALHGQAMIDEFDVDKDGEISLGEFSAIMKQTALYDNFDE